MAAQASEPSPILKFSEKLDTTLIGHYFGNSSSWQEVSLASPAPLPALREQPIVGARVRLPIFRRHRRTGVDQTLALSRLQSGTHLPTAHVLAPVSGSDRSHHKKPFRKTSEQNMG